MGTLEGDGNPRLFDKAMMYDVRITKDPSLLTWWVVGYQRRFIWIVIPRLHQEPSRCELNITSNLFPSVRSWVFEVPTLPDSRKDKGESPNNLNRRARIMKCLV